MTPSSSEHFDYIRHVSGLGPRCGCGGRSALHVGTGSSAKPGIFLCADCVTDAVGALFVDKPDQPPFWPGDEGRDETYVHPHDDPLGALPCDCGGAEDLYRYRKDRLWWRCVGCDGRVRPLADEERATACARHTAEYR